MKNDVLNYEDRKSVVLYRIEKAERTYQAALLNINNNYVETAANRLYYSAYYAVSALLLAFGIVARTHTGVKGMLGLHFINPKLLDDSFGILYARLLSLRMTGDYEDRKNLDMEEDVRPLVEPTKVLIGAVTKMAKDKMELNP